MTSLDRGREPQLGQRLLEEREMIACHDGLLGLLHNNNIISMGAATRSDDNAEIELKNPKVRHRRFIDP